MTRRNKGALLAAAGAAAALVLAACLIDNRTHSPGSGGPSISPVTSVDVTVPLVGPR